MKVPIVYHTKDLPCMPAAALLTVAMSAITLLYSHHKIIEIMSYTGLSLLLYKF